MYTRKEAARSITKSHPQLGHWHEKTKVWKSVYLEIFLCGVDFKYQYKRKTPLFSMWVSMCVFSYFFFFLCKRSWERAWGCLRFQSWKALESRILYLRPWLKCSDGLERDRVPFSPLLSTWSCPSSLCSHGLRVWPQSIVLHVPGGYRCQNWQGGDEAPQGSDTPEGTSPYEVSPNTQQTQKRWWGQV